MNDHVQDLEVKIEIILADYALTGDIKYILKADHYSHQLVAEIKNQDTTKKGIYERLTNIYSFNNYKVINLF